MNQYLFLFSVGPVQSYIEQARKTQDLYAGSYILSHLCRKALEALEHEEIIFPSGESQSVPNRLVALVRRDNNELNDFGKEIEKKVTGEFEKIAAAAITGLKPLGSDEQLKNYLTIHWLFLRLDHDYADKYAESNRLLGAIKQVRMFEQIEEIGRKCAICGERNVKFYRLNQKEHDHDRVKKGKLFTEDVLIVGYKEYSKIAQKFLQPGEGLCAVCFAKRRAEVYPGFSGFETKFPSTTEIALMTTLQKIKKEPRLEELDQNFRAYFKSEGDTFDHHLYYEENLHEQYFEKYGYDHLIPKLKEIQESHRELQKQIPTNQKYYAVLRFDGDSMGKWLAGDYLQDRSSTMLQNFHKTVSAKLGEFAVWAKNYLNAPCGKAVYSGGDDFLGFVNLESLFKVLSTLRQQFQTMVNVPLFEQQQFVLKDEYRDKRFTFSAGVVVAHYKTPLSEVLKWSRMMEDEAKKIDHDKDAFAIAVLKHSGEITKTVWKWNVTSSSIIGFLGDLVNMLQAHDETPALFSNTFISNLSQEFAKLKGREGKYMDEQLLQVELKRLLYRSCNLKREPQDTSKVHAEKKRNAVDAVSRPLMNMFTMQLSKEFEKSIEKSFTNFSSFLHIADFLARTSSGQTDMK